MHGKLIMKTLLFVTLVVEHSKAEMRVRASDRAALTDVSPAEFTAGEWLRMGG